MPRCFRPCEVTRSVSEGECFTAKRMNTLLAHASSDLAEQSSQVETLAVPGNQGVGGRLEKLAIGFASLVTSHQN